MSIKNKKSLIGIGLLSALAASLCCITPILALIAGSSGIASAFSWLEPARPYLIGVTVLVLGFAWYQKLIPIVIGTKKVDIDCACKKNEKTSFFQTKTFLGIVTVFALFMLAFPYYSHIFYPKTEAKIIVVESGNITEANFDIEGMTCTGCEEHIKNAVAQLMGFISAEANHKTGKTTIKFDKSKTDIEKIIAAIDETGYKVTASEIK